ncbi:MAG: hypothetical protein ABEH58_00045 [Haloplanus sp.]
MWTPSNLLGGVLALIASVPTRWFGPVPDDSYVFDPPQFSALWIERTVVPAVAVVAAVLLLVGLLALFRRDRERMARWQGWFAIASVIGAAVGTLATMLFATAGPQGTANPTAALNVLLGAGLTLLALLFLLPGLVVWGSGYLRAERPRLGAALAGGPVVALLVLAASVASGIEFGPVGALPVVLPVTLAVLVVGYDLWERPENDATA